MGLLMLLMPLASLVSFIGYVWLVRNAFKSSSGWGIAVLVLSPISAVVYAIKFWEDAKKPFLVYSGGTVGGVLVMVMMFGAMGGFEAMSMANDIRNGEMDEQRAAEFVNGQIARIESAGVLDSQGQADLERIKSAMKDFTEDPAGDESGDPANNDIAVDEPRGQIVDVEQLDAEAEEALAAAIRVRASSVVRETRRLPAGPVRVQDAGRYVGERVMAVGVDGIEHRGRMTSADRNAIWLEQYFSGGTFSVELKRSHIRSLEILD